MTTLLALLRPPMLVAIALGAIIATPGLASDAEANLSDLVSSIETNLDARVGIVVKDTASGWQWGYREDERFLMASTFKSVLCGAVLERVDEAELSLSEPIPVEASDIIDYAPVTEARVGATMTIGELCLATLDISDNTAANLLIERLGDPSAVTDFARRLGDDVTRLDRMEPDLNAPAADARFDTTSPSAMAQTWETMLLGDALSPGSQEQLADWMGIGGVTGALLRANTPENWSVLDKSGAGEGSRNLVAMVTPPDAAPYVVSIYLAGTDADFATRNEAVAQIGAGIVDLIRARLTASR
jgi:beta-lactamase class A